MIDSIRNISYRVLWWFLRRDFQLGKHYMVMYNVGNESSIPVKILRKYPDTVVEFSHFRIDDDGVTSFSMSVLHNPNNYNLESLAFRNYTNNIMLSVLKNAIAAAEEVVNEERRSDINESDQEREFHEEVSSVPQSGILPRGIREKDSK